MRQTWLPASFSRVAAERVIRRWRERPVKKLEGWASLELAPWCWRGLTRDDIGRGVEALGQQSQSIFHFDIEDNQVTCRDKPLHLSSNADMAKLLKHRASLYQALLTAAVRRTKIQGRLSLAIEVADMPFGEADIPIFSFQKSLGGRSVLLPDVDLLDCGFFSSKDYQDALSFRGKRHAAIFAGSTSGGENTLASVQTLALPRIRSAVFFKGNEDVIFKLPHVVQYDKPETKEAIEALGIGGPFIPWSEQIGYRYLLSIDGNGATCSRVALALLSNSVLCKYDSPHQLFYFRGLEPWVHYAPIKSDNEVEEILSDGARHPDHYELIAMRGREFAEHYLTREAGEIYVASLLTQYAQMLDAHVTLSPELQSDRLSREQIAGTVHVEDVGNLEIRPGAWGGRPQIERNIEGFTLRAPSLMPDLELEYSAECVPGDHQTATQGAYCGTQGVRGKILGFSVRITSAHAADYALTYQGVFGRSQMSLFKSDGEWCDGGGEALRAMKVLLKPRDA